MARRYDVFTREEIGAVIAFAHHWGPRGRRKMWVALFTLLANLGARVSEALLLRWQDVDFERNQVNLRTLKQRDKQGRPAIVYDTLPLDENTRNALLAVRNGDSPDSPIFRVNRHVTYNVFQRLLHRAGIPPRKLHALRHACATRILEETGDLMLARDILRHRDISTTSTYLHSIKLREKFLRIKPVG